MGSFRYTFGGDYDATNDQKGYYLYTYNEDSIVRESGFPDAIAIGVTSSPKIDNLNETNGEIFYQLTDSFGNVLNISNIGFALDYSDAAVRQFLLGGNLGDSIFAGSGDNVIAGQGGDDRLFGNTGNDHFNGGSGADFLDGGAGNNTAEYYGDYINQVGVTVSLQLNAAVGADAEGDTFTNIQNLTGSEYKDILAGDTNANVLIGGAGNDTLRSNGGADTLDGGVGNDRLVISQAVAGDDGISGVTVHGGDNVDTLFLQGHDTFKFDSSHFSGIEKIYVADGASLDLTGITVGVNIISQSTLSNPKGDSDNVTGSITGTDAADTIKGGKGDEFINGGAGGDKLTAGSGHDTFVFTEGFGRDNVYKFTVGQDHFDVSALVGSFDDVNIKQLNASDTLITFDGAGAGNKIILHDVAASSLHASDFGFFLP